MPERFSFAEDHDNDREERHEKIKRQIEQWLHQEQELLTSLTTRQLQSLYDQLFAGAHDDRVHAFHKWARVVRKKHLLLPDVRHIVASVDSFGLFREFIGNEAELHIRTAATSALSFAFASSLNREVSRFLANLVVNESLDRALRLRGYVGLWTVNQDSPRPRRKLAGHEPPRLKPSFSEYVDDFLQRSSRFREESEHFRRVTLRAEFSLDDEIRWDWVAKFLNEEWDR